MSLLGVTNLTAISTISADSKPNLNHHPNTDFDKVALGTMRNR